MALDATQLQNVRVGVPLPADLPLDQRTIESLGLPKEIDRRDLLAFLSSQSARLSGVVDPPLFRSLEADIAGPAERMLAAEATLSDDERRLLRDGMAEAMGLAGVDGRFESALASLDQDELDQVLRRAAGLIDQLTKDRAQRLREEAEREAAGPTDPGQDVTDPTVPLPPPPADDEVDSFFVKNPLQEEWAALSEFDLGGWRSFLRETAKKKDPMALIMAVIAMVEDRGGRALQGLGQNQVRLNDRLAAAADLSMDVAKQTAQDPRKAQGAAQRLNIAVGSMQNESQMNMLRVREHLTTIDQIQQALNSVKNSYYQTQQNVVRKISN